MTTHDDLARFCESLEGSVGGHDPFSYGVFVKGKVKGYVWTWLERADPKSKRIPNERVVAVRTPNLSVKEALLESNPEMFFTEDHYNGYPAILVRLDVASISDLEDLLIEAWKCVAPKTLKKWSQSSKTMPHSGD